MDTSDIPVIPDSDWQPITDKVDLAVLGKLGEELSECGTALWRCVIQGIDECEPVTNKLNRDWLMDEIADVEAMLVHVKEHFKLDRERIRKRRIRKYVFKLQWFTSLKHGSDVS